MFVSGYQLATLLSRKSSTTIFSTSLSERDHVRPPQDVERLRVADGAHVLAVHGHEVVPGLDATVAGKCAARRDSPDETKIKQ